ncbi:unnamed protein product [Miscanthus lutarioriparius]|uniref:DNA-directed DNA polymerase n=1 Tax=Miscanthus lutarioriparius TaxID=422564 RepID=A0A811NZJ2_9POAL|nr:unnamed protein product [Miscanthus lutarioriparius]
MPLQLPVAARFFPYSFGSIQEDSDNTHSVGIAQRARHPEELKRDPDKWMIDIDYCLSQQIHPVVSRLCASIQEFADSYYLDQFQSRVTESSNQDTSTMLLSVIDDEDERYRGCEPLRLSCPSCSGTFDCPPVSSLITSSTSVSDPNNVLCKTLLDDVLCDQEIGESIFVEEEQEDADWGDPELTPPAAPLKPMTFTSARGPDPSFSTTWGPIE